MDTMKKNVCVVRIVVLLLGVSLFGFGCMGWAEEDEVGGETGGGTQDEQIEVNEGTEEEADGEEETVEVISGEPEFEGEVERYVNEKFKFAFDHEKTTRVTVYRDDYPEFVGTEIKKHIEIGGADSITEKFAGLNVIEKSPEQSVEDYLNRKLQGVSHEKNARLEKIQLRDMIGYRLVTDSYPGSVQYFFFRGDTVFFWKSLWKGGYETEDYKFFENILKTFEIL